MALVVAGCALSGSVVDKGRFETSLTDMRLKNNPALVVFHGGSSRMIPLKFVNTCIVDPTRSLTYENKLYFGADITLKNGSRITSFDKDNTASTRVYLLVQDILIGKNDKECFIIRLEDVARIVVR
jgi:hypothetical protein